MTRFLSYAPFLTGIVSITFAVMVFRRFVNRRGLHLLFWSIGLLFYAAGGFCEGLNGVIGWNPLVFRLWYLFGAVLVAAWLGQGTVYLWLRRPWVHAIMAALVLGSAYAAIRVFGAELDPSLISGNADVVGEMSGRAIASGGVRSLTPIFNGYGTVALVGGAIWSVALYMRKRGFRNRAAGNVLIALGAMLPAAGGAISRFGIEGVLYLSEFLGVVIIFVGFRLAVAHDTSLPASR